MINANYRVTRTHGGVSRTAFPCGRNDRGLLSLKFGESPMQKRKHTSSISSERRRPRGFEGNLSLEFTYSPLLTLSRLLFSCNWCVTPLRTRLVRFAVNVTQRSGVAFFLLSWREELYSWKGSIFRARRTFSTFTESLDFCILYPLYSFVLVCSRGLQSKFI